MTWMRSWAFYGRGWHKTETNGKIMKRATSSSGWTQPGENGDKGSL